MTYEVAVSIYKISQDAETLFATVWKYSAEMAQIRLERLLTHKELYDTLCQFLAENNAKVRDADGIRGKNVG